MKYRLGFIGSGNMAEAIARAAIDKRIVEVNGLIASDPLESRRDLFSVMGITVTADNAEVISQSEQLLIAVKPQMMKQAAADIRDHGNSESQVLISIMAGIRTGRLAEAIGGSCRVVRVMPNTPMMIGCGMAALCLGEGAQNGDEHLAMQLFSAAGEAILVDESLMDAVTAVSGSGPAYVFYLAEAMQKAAEQLGLDDHAGLLVRQTVLGAAKLLCESQDAAETLRRKVTSPGGTTEAAIKHMEANGTGRIIIEALQAAAERSKELGG